jgi:hypothetical protein
MSPKRRPDPHDPGWGRWALKQGPATHAPPAGFRGLVVPIAGQPQPRAPIPSGAGLRPLPSQPTPAPHRLPQPPPTGAAFWAESPRRGFPL